MNLLYSEGDTSPIANLASTMSGILGSSGLLAGRSFSSMCGPCKDWSAGMVFLLLIWAFLAFSHSFMGRKDLGSHPPPALTAANEDTLLPMFSGCQGTATAPKVPRPVLCPSFSVALLCELLLKEAFLFQAVGVCWLWASLSIELRGAVHNSPASHFSSPRMLRLLVFPAPFSSVHSAQGLFASECGV